MVSIGNRDQSGESDPVGFNHFFRRVYGENLLTRIIFGQVSKPPRHHGAEN